jgi:hypothetical protein
MLLNILQTEISTFTEINVELSLCVLYSVLAWSDLRGSKYVVLMNTKSVVVLTVLVCKFITRKHNGISTLNIFFLLII